MVAMCLFMLGRAYAKKHEDIMIKPEILKQYTFSDSVSRTVHYILKSQYDHNLRAAELEATLWIAESSPCQGATGEKSSHSTID